MDFSHAKWVFASALIVVGFAAELATADLAFWVPATGNWNVGSNWTTSTVPGNEATAPKIGAIDNAGAATISSAVPTVDEVWVGDSAGQGTLNVTAGSLNATNAGQTGIIVVGRTFEQLGEHSGSRLNVSAGTVIADGIEAGQDFGGFASTDAQIIISGTGSVTTRNFLRVGHGGSAATGGGEGILTVRDNGQFIHNGLGTLAFVNDFIAFGFNGGENGVAGGLGGNTGTLNLEDNAIFNSQRPVRFGWVEEGHGFFNISDNAQMIVDSGELSPAPFIFGDFNNSAVGTGQNRPVGIGTQTGGMVTIGTDAERPRWTAVGGSGYGEYNMSGGTLNIWVRDGLNIGDTDQVGHPGEGVFNMDGGTLNATEMTVGKLGRATGIFTQDGGTVNVGIDTPDGNFVDRIDTLGEQTALDPNLDGKLTLGHGGYSVDFNTGSTTASGTYTITNGTLHALGMNVGFLSEGEFTQSGGTVIMDVGVIVAFGVNGAAVPSTGVMNLNGGVFETAAIGGGGGGNSTVNFNGTTIRATVDQPQFLVNLTTANVQAGGLIVDSNGFDVASDESFNGVGGLTKMSAGTLTMSGNSSYAGTTNVDGGTLLVNGSHTGGGAYSVDAGATLGGTGSITGPVTNNGSLAPGESIESLDVTGNVVMAANSTFAVELSAATSDLLAVTGDINLSATGNILDVSTLGTLTSSSFVIASYTGTLSGVFESIVGGSYSVDYGDGSNDVITLNVEGFIGDYNGDGKVSAADFTVWRQNLGAATLLNRDPDNMGAVDIDDFNSWKDHYGEGSFGSGAGAALTSATVPEPGSLMLTVLAFASAFVRMRTGRKQCFLQTTR